MNTRLLLITRRGIQLALVLSSSIALPFCAPISESPTTPSTPSQPAALPLIGTCDLQPNYRNEIVALQRWREFPIPVWVNADATVTASVRLRYEQAAVYGLRFWERATGGRVGAIYGVADSAAAKIIVRITQGSPIGGGASDPQGRGGVIERASITYNALRGVPNIERWEDERLWDWTAFTLAHEMGHALGIIGHSRSNVDLMGQDTPVTDRHLVPESRWYTTRDINTIMHAYCRSTPISSSFGWSRLY